MTTGSCRPVLDHAGRHLRHDALDGRARGGQASHAAIGRRAGGALPHLLVSALRLRPPARPHQGGRRGFDAGVFRAVAGQKLSRRLERRTRTIPRVPARVAETFSGQRMGQVAAPKSAAAAKHRSRSTGRRRTRNFRSPTPHEPSPDKAFDREWALALLAKVIERLQKECAADGKAKLFEQLKIFLTAGKDEHGASAKWPRRWAWRKARCAWRFIACGSVTANCCATKLRKRWPTPRTWTRKCGRCSARFRGSTRACYCSNLKP